MSSRLINLSKHIPIEFSRDPRSLAEMARWKGTELHLFRDYLSITVFKNILPDTLYNHYLHFHVAIRSFSRDSTCQIDGVFTWCRALLNKFVNDSMTLMGRHFVSSYIHYLIHVVDDVEKFGPLPRWNGYWAENYLQMLKSLVKIVVFL
jgi:hypothetical protein